MKERKQDQPSNANRVSSILPIPPLMQRKRLFAIQKRARPIENFMCVAVSTESIVQVRVRVV